ncbi:hypothetical protein WICMUC_001959 [Wickerhamomyces mucosus]|uniref:Uncharacterized protein n=1 Tax=Wickerhamomyces mucosus TaxID=1378264 RepID=A0A9P8PRF7_9ASCO|nr:hypothetical protein WICMUC_001959 [Wickerhamomyces mucosus]
MSVLLIITLITLYTSLVFPFVKQKITSKFINTSKLKQLQREKLSNEKKLQTISAKDEYAKYIKLERLIKKQSDEIIAEKNKTAGIVNKIESYLNYLNYGLSALLWIVRVWNRKLVLEKYSNGYTLGIFGYLFFLGQLINGIKFIIEKINVTLEKPVKVK